MTSLRLEDLVKMPYSVRMKMLRDLEAVKQARYTKTGGLNDPQLAKALSSQF